MLAAVGLLAVAPGAPARAGDAKVAGTPYHATGEVRCAAGTAAWSMCAFGVIRGGPGNAEVHLTAPDGTTRVLRFAGSRPAARDEVDARIVEAVGKGRLRIIDNPREVGGLKDIEPARQKAQVPERPFEPAKEGGPLRITAWLCQRGQELGADRTPECPLGAAQYGALLETRFSQRR